MCRINIQIVSFVFVGNYTCNYEEALGRLYSTKNKFNIENLHLYVNAYRSVLYFPQYHI